MSYFICKARISAECSSLCSKAVNKALNHLGKKKRDKARSIRLASLKLKIVTLKVSKLITTVAGKCNCVRNANVLLIYGAVAIDSDLLNCTPCYGKFESYHEYRMHHKCLSIVP